MIKTYIVDFKWENGRADFRTVDAESLTKAIEIFRRGGSWKGSYKDVEIISVSER